MRQIVRNDGDPIPRSASTRIVSTFEAGSITRASTSRRNASVPTRSNPRTAYASSRTSHNTRDCDPTTAGGAVTGVGVSASRSNASCPPWIFVFATSNSTASCSASCAEPTCSTIRRTPRSFDTICTAVAPDAVFTRRTNNPTPAVYEPRFSAPLTHPEPRKINDHKAPNDSPDQKWHESGPMLA